MTIRKTGKTVWLMEKLPAAEGVISVKTFNGETLTGYDAFRPKTGENVPILRLPAPGPSASEETVGRYISLRDGFLKSERWIDSASDSDTLVIDESGRLELAGGGYASALKRALFGERHAAHLL